MSEITQFQQHFDQDGAWTDWQTLHCNGWTRFAGDAGIPFVQNLLHPEPQGTNDLKYEKIVIAYLVLNGPPAQPRGAYLCGTTPWRLNRLIKKALRRTLGHCKGLVLALWCIIGALPGNEPQGMEPPACHDITV